MSTFKILYDMKVSIPVYLYAFQTKADHNDPKNLMLAQF